MIKSIITIIFSGVLLISLSSCQKESRENINELINELNKNQNYCFDLNQFTIEEKENVIYHSMLDNDTLLSFYCNKQNEINQCTLSSFNIKNIENYKLIINIGTILSDINVKDFQEFTNEAKKKGYNTKNGWRLSIIENNLAVTYILNQTTDSINNNQQPTLKNNLDSKN